MAISAIVAERGMHPIPRFTTFLRFAPVIATILVLFALTGDPAPGDGLVAHAIQRTPFGWLPAALAKVLAAPVVMFLVWCAGAVAALRARNWPLVVAAMLILVALAVNPVLKEAFARPRPLAADLIVRQPSGGYGFPSGHTSSATLMYGYAAASLGLVTAPAARRCLVAAAATIVALIAFERVYDGAHWPSDVAGGAVSGTLLIAGCVAAGDIIVRRLSRRRSTTPPVPDQAAVHIHERSP